MTTPLITRLEEAAEGSRELDAHVEVAVRAILAERSGLAREHWANWTVSPDFYVEDPHTAYRPEPVTTSLDAALALAERVLPGWMFAVAGPWTNTVVGRDFYCAEVVACTEESGVGYLEVNELGNNAPTPAQARCIAIH